MKQLVLALYAEGRTDERFLPVIVQREADWLLRQHALAAVDVLEPLSLEADPEASNRAKRILSVARQAAGFHALIVHADADAPTAGDVLKHRFQPGRRLVQESENDACRYLWQRHQQADGGGVSTNGQCSSQTTSHRRIQIC